MEPDTQTTEQPVHDPAHTPPPSPMDDDIAYFLNKGTKKEETKEPTTFRVKLDEGVETKKEERKTLTPDPGIHTKDSSTDISESLRMPEVEVTASDKEQFIKCVIADVPFNLDIELLGGAFIVGCKSKTTYEQNLMLYTLSEYIKSLPKDMYDLNVINRRGVMYHIAMMLVRINDTTYNYDWTSFNTLDDAKASLDYTADYVFSGMSEDRRNLIYTAIKIFDTKMLKMQEACVNKDFWIPVG
jgi:hypothetical protein